MGKKCEHARHELRDTQREALVLARVTAAAHRFAETHFAETVDQLEVATTRLDDRGRESWVFIATCRRWQTLRGEIDAVRLGPL